MPGKIYSLEGIFKGGVTALTKFQLPIKTDDTGMTEGMAWFNTTDNLFKYHNGTTVVSLGAASGLDTEGVQDIVGAMALDSGTLDFTYDDTAGTFTAVVKPGSITAAMVAADVATQAELDAASTADRSRANHTGTQAASTISDLTEAVQDIVGAQMLDSTSIDFTYDDAGAGTVTAIVKPGSITAAMVAADVATQAELDAVNAAIATASTNDRARANHTGTQLAATVSDFTEAAQDATGAMAGSSATAALIYTDATPSLVVNVLDSPSVGGKNAAQLTADAVAAIVDAAPGTLDTLNELAAALGDNPNFSTDVLAAVAAKPRFYAANLTGGATSEVVTHNLNTYDIQEGIYVNSGVRETEEYIVERTTLNTVTVRSEGANIPAGRRITLFAPGV